MSDLESRRAAIRRATERVQRSVWLQPSKPVGSRLQEDRTPTVEVVPLSVAEEMRERVCCEVNATGKHEAECPRIKHQEASERADLLGGVLSQLADAAEAVFAQYKHTTEGRITEEMITEGWDALAEARSTLQATSPSEE